MRTVTACLTGLALAALLTACGAASTSERSDSSPDPTPPARTVVSRDGAQIAYGPLRTASSAPPGTVSQAWRLVRRTDRRVYLAVTVPPCSIRRTFTLTTTSTSVRIGYWARPRPALSICAASVVDQFGFVELPTGLGRRTLVPVPAGTRAS